MAINEKISQIREVYVLHKQQYPIQIQDILRKPEWK